MIHLVSNSNGLNLGGAERIVNRLHRKMMDAGEKVQLVSLYDTEAGEYVWDLQAKSPYSLKAILGLWRYFRSKTSSGDLVHVHLFPTTFYCALLKSLGVIKPKMIMTEHSTSNRRRNTFWGRMLDQFIYARYDGIAVISKGVGDRLLGWLPQLGPKVRLVQNGIELNELAASDRPFDPPKLVSVGNLRPAKNYENAIKAISQLKGLNFTYHIYGSGPLQESLEELIRQEGLQDKVFLEGRTSDVYQVYRSADVFIMPSSYEGFGLAAVEAMHSGLAIILSDVDGLTELIRTDPEAALLVKPEKPEDIAAAVAQLIEDKASRLRLGEKAKALAQQFDLLHTAKAYQNLYQDIRN